MDRHGDLFPLVCDLQVPMSVGGMFRQTVLSYVRRFRAGGEPPERIAIAFAVGVFLAFSPLLGLHAFLGLLVAFLFGLNRVAILIGIFINNPWTLVPIYALGHWVGRLVIGYPGGRSLPNPGWDMLWHSRFWIELARNWPALMPLVVGSFLLASIAGVVSYFLALRLLRHGHSNRMERAAHPADLSAA